MKYFVTKENGKDFSKTILKNGLITFNKTKLELQKLYFCKIIINKCTDSITFLL